MVEDEEVVETAAEAAEGAVFAQYDRSAVSDFDVTATFEDGALTLDIYLDTGADSPEEREREEAVVEEAITAARDAVDQLLAE